MARAKPSRNMHSHSSHARAWDGMRQDCHSSIFWFQLPAPKSCRVGVGALATTSRHHCGNTFFRLTLRRASSSCIRSKDILVLWQGWDSIVCKFIHQNQNSMSKFCKIRCSGFDSCQIFLVRAPPKWSPESSSFLVRMHPLDVSNHSGAGCWCGNLGFHYWRRSCMLQIATVNYLGDVGGAWETKNQNQHSTAQKCWEGKQNRAWRQRQFHLFTVMDSVRSALGKNWKRSEKAWTARIIALHFEKHPTGFSHKIQGLLQGLRASC